MYIEYDIGLKYFCFNRNVGIGWIKWLQPIVQKQTGFNSEIDQRAKGDHFYARGRQTTIAGRPHVS